MILMLTALDTDQDQIEGLMSGADDYVVKPIEPKVLLARLQALQRRHHQPVQLKELVFGKLHLNLIERIVTLSGVRIALKPMEFELLIFLAKNADRIVNRENIMQALRGISFDGIDRTIDLRISYLRKKLQDNIEEPYRIKTVHAKGYILSPLLGTPNVSSFITISAQPMYPCDDCRSRHLLDLSEHTRTRVRAGDATDVSRRLLLVTTTTHALSRSHVADCHQTIATKIWYGCFNSSAFRYFSFR